MQLVTAALATIGATLDEVTAESVAAYFGKYGAGSSKKADFAEAIVDAIDSGVTAAVPDHIAEALEFLWASPAVSGSPNDDTEQPPDAPPPAD